MQANVTAESRRAELYLLLFIYSAVQTSLQAYHFQEEESTLH